MTQTNSARQPRKTWDALTDEQKELVEGENADPDYFGRDTGDASKDDPLNGDEIGENELLVVSFGTSFNDSRTADIGGIEKALAAAYPDCVCKKSISQHRSSLTMWKQGMMNTSTTCSRHWTVQ